MDESHDQSTQHESTDARPQAGLPEPQFCSLPVYKGPITCQICFESVQKKHLKRGKKFERLSDWSNFSSFARKWAKTGHEFNKVFQMVEWNSTGEKWAHKACEGKFFKEQYLVSQDQLLETDETRENEESFVAYGNQNECNVSEDEQRRRSDRQKYRYESSWQSDDKKRCIICNEDKRIKGRLVDVQTITITEKAEKTLKEFAEIHVKSNNQKYIDGARRILLTLSTSSLLAADVAYHKKLCYEPFRSPVWKKTKEKDAGSNYTVEEEWAFNEICQLIEIHILARKEVYSLAQLRNCYDQIRSDKGLPLSRSIDMKQKLLDKFGSALQFIRPENSSKKSEYVLPSGLQFTANCITASKDGGGIPTSVAVKNVAKAIHESVKRKDSLPWPPTPQDILESKRVVDTHLHNLLGWIVQPNATLNDNGLVSLSKSKASKIMQLAQNIESLMPNAKPSLDQALLSLTMHRKTGSSAVVNTLHHLGHGISYTETVFIEDKWAEWGRNCSSDIPSNILRGLPTTHVADNIDWKNKELSGYNETHNTNSILIQHKIRSDALDRAQVSLKPSYDFVRKHHRSFKSQPVILPEFIGSKRSACKTFPNQDDSTHEEYELSSKKNMCWALCRYKSAASSTSQTIPGWSGFQEKTTDTPSRKLSVGYLPAITASPTNMNVILGILNRTVKCMKELHLSYIFLEVDQAIYSKVLQVMFKYESEGRHDFDKVIVRMGGFHVIICMLRTIYSRFKGSGIVELLSEAGVGAEGTIKAAMKGSNVKQGVRYYKLLFEALLRTKLADTEKRKEQQRQMQAQNTSKGNVFTVEDPAEDSTLDEAIDATCNNMTETNVNKVIFHPDMKVDTSSTGDMAAWMDSLIEMIDLLLNTIHFQRIGNWEGYLQAIDEFLPWCFALNRQNYARNLSYFYADMRALSKSNPSAYSYLEEGGFSGSLGSAKHSQLPMDQIIEMTINRFSKETGGLSGQTENKGASERWMRINHYIAALKQHLETKVRKAKSSSHLELGSKRMQKDEADVQRIVEGLNSWIPELWSQQQPLVNICNGVLATDEMTENVKSTKRRGVEARKQFVERFTLPTQSTITNEEPAALGEPAAADELPVQSSMERAPLSYHDPIKKQAVITFENQVQRKKTASIPEDEGKSFAAILAEYDSKKLDLHEIMHWPITSKPWSLCNDKGDSRGSSKSLFRNNLQLLSPIEATAIPPEDIECCIVDAMRIVRIIPINDLNPPTFKSWAERLACHLRALPGNTIHVVFDDYDKDPLCLSKGRLDSGKERKISDISQKLPKLKEWNTFLTSDKNKLQLTHLLADYLLSKESLLEKDLFVTKGSQCFFRAKETDSWDCVPSLCSSHKEADPRLALHAVYASSNHNGVCVVADDTDVYILLLYVSRRCSSSLYFRQGVMSTKQGVTYHDIKSLATFLGESICESLSAFHALTGCDYTMPFFGRSKFSIFKRLLKDPTSCDLLSSLHSQEADEEQLVDFVLHIVYSRPQKEKVPGDSRYSMLFSGKSKSKKKFTSTKNLPPDIKSLRMKFKRANLVTHSMVNCLDIGYEQLDPTAYGWERKDEGLRPKWFEGNALPAEQDLSEMLQASELDDIESNDDTESSEERGIAGEQQSDEKGEESDTDNDNAASEGDESEYAEDDWTGL